jgi:hypothetical protein
MNDSVNAAGFPALINDTTGCFAAIMDCVGDALRNRLPSATPAAISVFRLTGVQVRRLSDGTIDFSGELRDPVALLKTCMVAIRLAHSMREMMQKQLTGENAGLYIEVKNAVDIALRDVLTVTHPDLVSSLSLPGEKTSEVDAKPSPAPRDAAAPADSESVRLRIRAMMTDIVELADQHDLTFLAALCRGFSDDDVMSFSFSGTPHDLARVHDSCTAMLLEKLEQATVLHAADPQDRVRL